MQFPAERIKNIPSKQDTVAPKAVQKSDRITATHEQKQQTEPQDTDDVLLGVKDESLKLLCHTVIDHINLQFKDQLEDPVIKKQADIALIISPHDMADKIAQLTIQSYQTFKLNHLNLDNKTAIKDYLDKVHKGLEKGFTEAQNILENLGALNEGSRLNINKTYQRLNVKLDLFLELIEQQDK